MRPLLFQFRTGAGAGGCGSVATLLFAVFVLQLGSSARTVVHAKQKFSDADNYLYHTEDAAGIIIDYEPEKPETATPDFIYGADQGPRVVEFYAPWCPHVCAVIASRIIPGLIIHHLHCTLIVSLTLVSFRLFISNLLSVTIHNGIFHARVRTRTHARNFVYKVPTLSQPLHSIRAASRCHSQRVPWTPGAILRRFLHRQQKTMQNAGRAWLSKN